MFKFINSIVAEMRLVTWPTRSEAVKDFGMVIQYSIFFMVFIIFFTVAYLPRYSLDITDKISKKHQCRTGICLFCRTLCKTEIRTVRIK